MSASQFKLFGRNRNSFWGSRFRFLVAAQEVLVLVFPLRYQNYEVFEIDKGVSQVTIRNGILLLSDWKDNSSSTCLANSLEYPGFMPSAFREVYWLRLASGNESC